MFGSSLCSSSLLGSSLFGYLRACTSLLGQPLHTLAAFGPVEACMLLHDHSSVFDQPLHALAAFAHVEACINLHDCSQKGPPSATKGPSIANERALHHKPERMSKHVSFYFLAARSDLPARADVCCICKHWLARASLAPVSLNPSHTLAAFRPGV